MPPSAARSRIARDVGSSHCSPKVIVPRHSRDTWRPVRPSRLCSTPVTLPVGALDNDVQVPSEKRGLNARPGGPDSAHDRVELLRDADRANAGMLLIDGVAESHLRLDDPLYLDFEYVRRIGHLIDLAAPPGTPLRVLHLGAGGLTLARYMAGNPSGASQLAAGSDAEGAAMGRRL